MLRVVLFCIAQAFNFLIEVFNLKIQNLQIFHYVTIYIFVIQVFVYLILLVDDLF